MNTEKIFEKSVLIVAHPDDEVLWFSSVIRKVDRIIICFSDCASHPEWSSGRRESLAEYPLGNIESLDIHESEAFFYTDWNEPVTTMYGIHISGKKLPDRKYKDNYHFLKQLLGEKLAGFKNVITHNPWGEYGHVEHVQIYRVIKELKKEMKFSIWFSNYCSNKSFNLMQRYISGYNSEYITLQTDRSLGESIKSLYERHGCWTWYSDWKWFREESFMNDADLDLNGSEYGHTIPLNMIKVDVDGAKRKKSVNSVTNVISKSIDNRGGVKGVIKGVLRKAGIEISRYSPEKSLRSFVSLEPEGKSLGNVLLSYVLDPFLLKEGEAISSSHTNHWESLQIAQTFLDLGYCVDVIHYEDKKFVPEKKYSILVAARTNFQRIAELLDEDCIKIVHLDTSHWMFNNFSSYRRSMDLLARRGVTVRSMRLVEPNLAIEFADHATVLGNDFTLGTYSYARKPIYKVPVPSFAVYRFPENRDYERYRKNYFWFGSSGLVHKGLDLLLEIFSNMPDYHLTVCGPIDDAGDFKKAFYKELYHTSNIHTVGWIDITSQEFIDITSRCIGLIYPSSSEGQSGAVVTCLQTGLIPVLSYESGVDVEDFGIILKDCSIDEIKSSIQKISDLPSEKLRLMSCKAWEYARANFTRESFTKRYREVIDKIIKSGDKS